MMAQEWYSMADKMFNLFSRDLRRKFGSNMNKEEIYYLVWEETDERHIQGGTNASCKKGFD